MASCLAVFTQSASVSTIFSSTSGEEASTFTPMNAFSPVSSSTVLKRGCAETSPTSRGCPLNASSAAAETTIGKSDGRSETERSNTILLCPPLAL